MIRNQGKTPAYHVSVGVMVGVKPTAFPDETSVELELARGIFSPNAYFEGFADQITIERPVFEKIRSHAEVRLYFYGVIAYEDAFRKCWRQRFCYYDDWAADGTRRIVSAGHWNDELSST